MKSESSNSMLGRLDKLLVMKYVLKPTHPQTDQDTKFKMVRGRTIKMLSFEMTSPYHFANIQGHVPESRKIHKTKSG